MGDWLFGCDICQDVCPWNRRAPESVEPTFVPAEGRNPIDLAGLFSMTDDDFRRLFRGSPLLRAKRRGLLRSAAIVLGNGGDPASLAPLVRGLSDDEPLVRGAAAWALGRLNLPTARDALAARLEVETDADVRDEIEAALLFRSPISGGH
jgi:epoxyqueuosine reductase